MTAMIPRLHSVRLKAGGAKLRIMHSPRDEMSQRLWCTLQADAKASWSTLKGAVAGFSLVAWSSDGVTTSIVYNTKFSPVPNAVVPTMVEEAVRDSFTHIRVNRALGRADYDEGPPS